MFVSDLLALKAGARSPISSNSKFVPRADDAVQIFNTLDWAYQSVKTAQKVKYLGNDRAGIVSLRSSNPRRTCEMQNNVPKIFVFGP